MFCVNCGAQFEGNFCPECGTKAAAASKATFNDVVANEQEGAGSQGKKGTRKIRDKIFNKLTGRNIESIKIDQEEAVKYIQELFINQAETEEELDQIYKLISYVGLTWNDGKEIFSKDNKYRLWRHNDAGAGSTISIGDLENEKYYICNVMFMKKIKDDIKKSISDRKVEMSVDKTVKNKFFNKFK